MTIVVECRNDAVRCFAIARNVPDPYIRQRKGRDVERESRTRG